MRASRSLSAQNRGLSNYRPDPRDGGSGSFGNTPCFSKRFCLVSELPASSSDILFSWPEDEVKSVESQQDDAARRKELRPR